jgi:hypothetical protein
MKFMTGLRLNGSTNWTVAWAYLRQDLPQCQEFLDLYGYANGTKERWMDQNSRGATFLFFPPGNRYGRGVGDLSGNFFP